MRTEKSDNNSPTESVEPVTTLVDEEKFVRILTELPDIAEEKIKINLENRSSLVTIIAVNSSKIYKKVIPIPYEVRIFKKRFSDGILELTLEKNKS